MKRILTFIELLSSFGGLLLWLFGTPSLHAISAAIQYIVLALILTVAVFGFWLGAMILIAQREPPYK